MEPFSDHVKEAGGVILNSIPNKPQTHATEERFHDTLEKGTRATMEEANAPLPTRPFAVVLWNENFVRMPDGRPEQRSPYERKRGKKWAS